MQAHSTSKHLVNLSSDKDIVANIIDDTIANPDTIIHNIFNHSIYFSPLHY